MRTSLAALLAVAAATAAALPTISITGNKFFTSEGNQWFVKGKQSFLELHHLINYFCFPCYFSISLPIASALASPAPGYNPAGK